MSTSLEDIKRAAKKIQARDGYGYCQALEIAARNAGFRTYAAAKVALQRAGK
ncbi:hypothetical protein [Stenotrophomonas sp. MMGLT7]|uniref:hypothetical protein n=1 Tax=Stenotrophomonas sp. MMGLT7 TaxID=2901227 RepID=UPI001E58E465|nr:hypothetical protein [Stenotrophomonas sp. MMGLT7]MCD7099090.1 hypothetical protein [Stenotrophomonas sp. MMGLT7]